MEIRINCPVCVARGKRTPDVKRHLYVNPEKNKAHCWRCEFGTNHAKDFCRRYRIKIEFPRIIQPVENTVPECRLPREFTSNWRTSPFGPQALRYLQKRYLSRLTIHAYGIGHCPYGEYGRRIVIPIYENSKLVHFQARDWTELQYPKYLGPPHVGKGRMFNFDRVRRMNVVVLVEGIFDALRLPRYATALLGKALQNEQRDRLFKAKPNTVLILLDEEAKKDAERIRNQLVGCSIRHIEILDLPDGTGDLGVADPDYVHILNELCDEVQSISGGTAEAV